VVSASEDAIIGKLGETVEVFRAYETDVPPPHVEFAQCGEEVENILRFTTRWGPLWSLPETDNKFWFRISEWRAYHTEYTNALRASGDGVTPSLEQLIKRHAPAPFRPPFNIGFQRLGELRPVIVAGCLWDALRLMAWMDQTVGRSVWVPCKNERCQKFFQRTRPDKLCCSPECSRQIAQRKYWHAEKGGAYKRRLRRKCVPME
jgi:hypothetical protein